MGRPSRSRALGVWTNGIRVGRWVVPASGPTEFSYDPAWVDSEHSRPLSLSLPMNLDGVPLKGDQVGFFFDNLLPDSQTIRRRIQTRFHTTTGDTFDLLSAVGRDCVGAVQLLPDGVAPEGVFQIDVTPLRDSEIENTLRGVVSETADFTGVADDFRISLAGAQEKTALTRHRGKWCRPHSATPTTHIFKLPLGRIGGRQLDMSSSLENEWLCARILAAYGVDVAPSELGRFGSTRALIVSRFDRQLDPSKKYWLRLPQEDFCQATGTPSSSKYESDGGPGLTTIARVLQASEERQRDLETLLRAQLLFWMLAAVDGHAKNFSIRLLPGGRFRLTPLYDVISAWPVTGRRHDQIHSTKLALAMALLGKSKHYRISQISRRHFNFTAQRCGLGPDMEGIIEDVIARTPSVIERVGSALPKGFPMRVFDAIAHGLGKSATQFAAMAVR